MIGDQSSEEIRIHIIDYTETYVLEDAVESLDDCERDLARDSVTWINNSTGLGNIRFLERIGERFGVSSQAR